MKPAAKFIFVFVIFTVGIPANAMQPGSYGGILNVSLADVSIGGVFPSDHDDSAFELGVSALSFGVEPGMTGLGMWFSPFNFFLWRDGSGNIERNFSFINFDFYWNLNPNDVFYFGPFIHANYLILSEEKVDCNKYIFTAGLRGGVRIPIIGLLLPLISLETGVRFIDGEFNFLVAVKIDFWSLLIFLM